MASRKITQLTELTAPASADVLPIVDVSEASPENQNKKITYAELLSSAPAGTAAAPAFAFDGDPNSGVYSVGADQVAISTGGTGRLFVDADGAVRIENSAVNASPLFRISTFNGYAELNSKRSSGGSYSQLRGTYAGNATAFWQIGSNGFTDGSFAIWAGANAQERLRITSAGNVGIGTSSPGQLLHLQGASPALQFEPALDSQNSLIIFRNAADSATRGLIYYNHSNDSLNLTTNGTLTDVIIDSSGRVGIGTQSPSHLLQVSNTSSNPFISIRGAASNVGGLLFGDDATDAVGQIRYDHSTDAMYFVSNSTERARIDSSGRLLVGTSTAPQSFEGGTTIGIQAENTGNGNKNLLRLVSNAVANWSPVFSFARSRGTANGAVTAVASGDVLGVTSYAGADGTGHIVAAQIFAAVDGTPGTNDMPGRLVFSTTADGAASPTERMRITSAGNVGIGTASPSTALHVVNPTGQALFEGSVQGGITIQKAGTLGINLYSDAAGTLVFYNLNGNTERARIDSSGRLLVGAATSADVGGASAIAQFTSTAVAPHTLSLVRANTPILAMANSGSVSSGSGLGAILFCGNDGTDLNSLGARIVAEVDGTPGADDMPGRLVFSTTADGAASPTERMRITSTGQVRLAGAGITFNGDTATANELDDYEEGTFTPVIQGSTTAGTGTYTVQSGKYVKIGGKVHVEVSMTWTAHTGAGSMWFGGLPFTSAATGNGPGISLGRVSNIALTANNVLLAYVASNSTIAPLRQYPVGGGAEATVPIDTAGEVNFSVTYMVV